MSDAASPRVTYTADEIGDIFPLLDEMAGCCGRDDSEHAPCDEIAPRFAKARPLIEMGLRELLTLRHTPSPEAEDEPAIGDLTNHYEKACVDHFDYAVLVKVGNDAEWLRIHEIKDHGDGWVTLTLPDPDYANDPPTGKVFGKYPMPRGLSIRKDYIVAVVDAPEGS